MDVNRPSYVVAFTVAVSAVFTGAITVLQVATAPVVKRNEVLREQKALVSVLGLGDVAKMTAAEIAAVVERRIDRTSRLRDLETGREFELIRAYRTDAAPGTPRPDADLLAVAIPVSGVGFWARITGLLALTPDLRRIVGLVFLDQAETPGLGGRITEPAFLQQFQGLNATPPAAGGKLLYLGGGAPTNPQDPRAGRYVDAITGATQTSLAVGKFLNENLRAFRRAVAAADTR